MKMKNRFRAAVGVIAAIGLSLGGGSAAYSQTQSQGKDAVQKETVVTKHASGPFEVKVNPLPAYNDAEGAMLGRMSLDKQFHGDLEATSKGEMLTAGTNVKGSAGYVAIERVSGTLHGRSGTFALQHIGAMNRGEPQMTITVVPDSGTGQLVGLAGKMAINIADGKHSYDFEYTLAGTEGKQP